MSRYRKRPVEVDVRQFTTDTKYAVLAWIREHGGTATEASATDGRPVLYIHTLEGNMQACPGDWIVQGVRGEFHPVRADIFTETYESAAVPPTPADGATAFRQAADAIERIQGYPRLVLPEEIVAELRRQADEAQHPAVGRAESHRIAEQNIRAAARGLFTDAGNRVLAALDEAPPSRRACTQCGHFICDGNGPCGAITNVSAVSDEGRCTCPGPPAVVSEPGKEG